MRGHGSKLTTATFDSALALVAGWPTRATAGVTDVERVLGHAGPDDEIFAWASVTKLLTTMAVLLAVEEETVTLDQPAGPPGSTISHLLAHASGLARDGAEVVAPPATRRLYSNRGIELAALAVEEAAGMPFVAYLDAGILTPLAMTATRVQGSPASGATGPLGDLLRLGRELLAPTLLSGETMVLATSTAWPGLAGVLPGFGRQDPCDWGLGFELRHDKHPHWTGTHNSPETFGHFGLSGAFLWVDPVAGLAAAALGSQDFGPWAAQAWPVFSDAVLAAG